MLGNADRSLEPQLTARFNDETNVTFYKKLIEEYRGEGFIKGAVEYQIEDRSDFRSQVCGQNVAIIFDSADDLDFFLSQRGRDVHNPHDSYDNIYNRVFHHAANVMDTFPWNDYVRAMKKAEDLGDKGLLNQQQDLLTSVFSYLENSPERTKAVEIYDAFRLEVAQTYRLSQMNGLSTTIQASGLTADIA